MGTCGSTPVKDQQQQQQHTRSDHSSVSSVSTVLSDPTAALEPAALDLNEAHMLAHDDDNYTEATGLQRSWSSSSSSSSNGSSRSSSRSGGTSKRAMSQGQRVGRRSVEAAEEEGDDKHAMPSDSNILPGAVAQDDDLDDIPTVISAGGTETDSGHSDYQDGLSDDDDGDQETRCKGVPVVKVHAGGFMLNEEMMMG